jgi:hypothetical protein
MKGRKGGKKGTKKGGKREPQRGGGLIPTLFCAPFRALLFPFPPELHVPRFLWCSTLFVLLIEKGGNNRAKNEENGKKGEKGRKRVRKRA